MPRRGLCDATWASIRDILVRIPGIRKTNEADLRKFIEAVFFVLRTGVPWADLPAEFGPPATAYRRFRRWTDKRIWDRLRGAIAIEQDGTVMIDSTYVKLHRSGTGARGGKSESIGRSRGGLTTKVHVAINGAGHILRVLMTAGNAADCRSALPLIEGLTIERLLADRAYDTNAIRDRPAAVGAKAVIPSRVCRKEQIPHDAEVYKTRHRVENTFCRLKDFVRFALRRDKTSSSFGGFVDLAVTIFNTQQCQ